MTDTDIIDYAEAVKVTGIKRATLYSLVSEKRIPHLAFGPRLIRFRRSELAAWVQSHSVGEGTAARGDNQ